jgi:hypothetical protein
MVYLLNFVPYNKTEAIQLLEKELKWKDYGGKHYESKYTGFIQSYYLFKKFSIDYRKATLSSQICANSITRAEALEILKNNPYNEDKINREIEFIAKKLGITKDSLIEIIDSKPKWYEDYPNDEKWLKYVYDTYRKIFKKEKLASF